MFVLTKTLSHNWQGQFSYVWSRTKGNINNAGRSGFGGSGWENPVNAIVNTDGYLSNDRTHEIKIMAGYTIPKIDVSLNAYVRSISGGTYTPVPSSTVSSRTLNWFSSLRPYLEPLGTLSLPDAQDRRLEIRQVLQVRWQPLQRVGGRREPVQRVHGHGGADALPEPDDLHAHGSCVVLYDSPTAVTTPRQIMVGGRWSF